MAANKQGKMQNLINYRMRVTLNDGRQMTGQMLAFDKHMNLVLADTEEFRRVKRKPTKAQAAPGSTAPALVESEEKRTLGLAIVRGTHIISLSVDGPPPADPSARLGTNAPGGAAGAAPPTLAAGPGISRPAGRGLPLSGPAAGVGGPAPGFGGFPPAGFPGSAPPPGFPGRAGPPGFAQGFPGAPAGGPPGFSGAPGFQAPPGQGRGFPPPGFGGR
ncbi:Sm-like ribonucleo protein [Xylona heveae TC161]|uniref:Sm protein B n=1 Tax=Xylona heveae (strain CBS 132557 / TC161) TaxID=1328760 RepID=A0A161TFD9_XYLHT|nr:Sm-like ribonucleo protein [Xylona heveae TC161]KZF24737.1 Sm-like ribonucleo protein [Xylona heveae TC161]